MSYVAQRIAEIQSEIANRLAQPTSPKDILHLEHVEVSKTRHGKVVYYYRVGKGERIRLPDRDKVSPSEFVKAYDAAKNGERLYKTEPPSKRTPSAGELWPAGRSGHVYFVRSGDTVKIGFSTNINSRLSTLQNANPDNLQILMVMPGTDQTEKFFHEMFADFRIGGEWFSLTGYLAEFVGLNPSKKRPCL